MRLLLPAKQGQRSRQLQPPPLASLQLLCTLSCFSSRKQDSLGLLCYLRSARVVLRTKNGARARVGLCTQNKNLQRFDSGLRCRCRHRFATRTRIGLRCRCRHLIAHLRRATSMELLRLRQLRSGCARSRLCLQR
jgi:hypothetical protein